MNPPKPYVKVTIETSNSKGVAVSKNVSEDLSEVLECVQQAIKGCGFYPRGYLDFIDDELHNIPD